jgi:hypothetical protein
MSPSTDPNAPAGAHEGGCLCGAIRFRATAEPVQTTICHCRFCQRVTGSAFLVEPIFGKSNVVFSGAAPKVYERRSDGSGKLVRLNFCGECGSPLFLGFDRFPDYIGVFAGAFDDPNWFDRGPGKARHIFTCTAQKGVAVPAGIEVYADHAIQLDGTPNPARMFMAPTVLSDEA